MINLKDDKIAYVCLIQAMIRTNINSPHIKNAIEIVFLKNYHKLDMRQLANIIHSVCELDKDFLTEKTLNLLIKTIENHPDMGINLIDFSSLLHAFDKLDLKLEPFLKYITPELLDRTSPAQLSIIIYALRNYLKISLKSLFKAEVLKKMNQMNSKHIMNMGLM